MEPEWLRVILLWGACIGLAGLTWCAPLGRLLVRAGTFLVVHAPRRHREVSGSRPIELIAVDARRLGRRFHHPPYGVSFARFEGTRWAYDKVLAESCRALGIDHLLEVLEPGPALDAERNRVEFYLGEAGFRIDQTA
ncbi:MAG: hypothetical protein WBQ50_05690 [Nocardioides sp.]